MNAHDKLMILTDADYMQLRCDLKAAGLDRCYMALAAQSVRLDWSPKLFNDLKFRQQAQCGTP